MKSFVRTFLVLVCVLAAMALTACDLSFLPIGPNPPTPPPPEPGEWTPTGADVDVIDGANLSASTITYAMGLIDKAEALNAKLAAAGISGVAIDSTDASYKIIIGVSSDKASELAKAKYEEAEAAAPADYHWAFCYYDGSLAIYAGDDFEYARAFEALITDYVNGGKLTVRDDLALASAFTEEQYEEYLSELDRLEYEANREANAALISGLLAKVNAQRTELKDYIGERSKHDPKGNTEPMLLFNTYTPDLMELGSPSWSAPAVSPKDEHPRLLVTSDMYASIRESIALGGKQGEAFKALIATTLPNDGILGDLVEYGMNATTNSNSVHNFNYEYLEVIQAKALAHLIYDDDYYGYQAVYYMKNFLKSLDIKRMYNDQMRDYGYIMFTAALVYDWCYDLLDEDDKIQFISGVENCLCVGSNSKGAKTEVGFPPSKLGSVADHACEYMILRDYLSFAVAIYGDNSSWWDYVGGRVYAEYVPMRNYYYKSGMTSQGTGVYITARFVGDIYSAWILKTATGENPYVNMEAVLRSCLSYEFEPGKLFNDGDGDGNYVAAEKFIDIAYMSAYLYSDPTVLAQANFLLGDKVLSCGSHEKGYVGINGPIFLALTGSSDVEPAGDRYEGLNLINYNGHPLGQYLVHSAWNDPAAASVFMRIKERSTSNHEHYDSGTFEIYYKGMLTSDAGVYNGYGTTHTIHYHQATISHNGLIIYDLAKKDTLSGMYSGGQKTFGGSSSTFDFWIKDKNKDTGTVTGRQHGYVDGDETKPLYAYIAGDISEAYDADTAPYVGRRMLTVFTGDEEFPMAFFVFDDITSKQGCERRFLLQITSSEKPDIVNDKKKGEHTVTTENGDGRLVLTCLTSGNIIINGVGGRNAGKYDASKSQNYMVNGKQIVPNDLTRDDGHWGRVEIILASAKADITFMNVIYVTDAGNKNDAEVTAITEAVGLEGGVFNEKIAGLFATSRTGAEEALSCTTEGEGELDYYVSGVKAGSWTVTVDGKDCGTYTATEEGGLLTFTAPAGDIVISPAE